MGQYDEPVINEELITDGEHHTNFDAAGDIVVRHQEMRELHVDKRLVTLYLILQVLYLQSMAMEMTRLLQIH